MVKKLYILVIALVFFWGCKKEKSKPDLPDISIVDISNVNQTKLANTSIERYRLGVSYNPGNNIEFRNIIEYSLYSSEGKRSEGFFACQDISTSWFNKKLRIDARYGVFDTQDYNSAIYAYENSVMSSFSFPALSGKGYRSYIMAKAKLYKMFTLGMRYSLTQYADRTNISDGLTQIQGSRQSDIVFQLTADF